MAQSIQACPSPPGHLSRICHFLKKLQMPYGGAGLFIQKPHGGALKSVQMPPPPLPGAVNAIFIANL